jgi:molecular chaperone DnaK
MGKSIGIDLGTTNSVVAFKDATVRVIATGPNNEDLCRSCVGVDKSGSFAVGNAVYRGWKRYAPNIVVSVKRLMGASISDPQVQKMKQDKEMYPYGIKKMSGGTEESVVVVLNGKEYTPEQISAEILRRLKEDASVKLGDEVTHAVITVPAYFNEKQKTATRKAAELAGLKVQRLLAEPTAAAISYGADKMAADEDKIFLVYDFGGGTFDLSILVASGGNFIESGTGGDRWLGGDDIDRLVSEYVLSEAGKANNVDVHEIINSLPDRKRYAFNGEFKGQIEDAKKTLSQTDSTSIGVYDMLEDEDGNPIDIEVTLTRAKFEEMIRPLVQRTLDLIDELLEKTAYPIDTIDNILLVGGSSCIPLVREMLSAKYGKDKILSSEKPMLAVAEGAAILSHSMGTEAECPNCGKVIPVGSTECPYCHHSLEAVQQVPVEEGGVQVSITTKHKVFIQLSDDADNIEYREIIDENTPLPYEVNHKFHTLVENQKIVGVKLFSDAEDNKMDKLSTGYFTIPENLPVHSELQFTFSLTEDEVMSVKVRVPATGKTTNVVLGRGALDAHCLEAIGPTFDKVMNDQKISDSKKADFVEKLQKIIDNISSNHYDPRSDKWQEAEDSLKSASQVALTNDDDTPVEMIIAQIQLENFGRFIRPEDKEAMRAQLQRAQQATTPMEKNAAVHELSELTEKFGLFTHGFILNIVGHDDSDPVKANQALVAFNQFMAALNEGNVQRAREILDANEHLIEGSGVSLGGTTGIGG